VYLVRNPINTAGGVVNGTRDLTHAVSDDGRFVFFDTDEALVTQDTNGVRDVYEYDTLAGQVHLISSGESDVESTFENASPTGSDVVFLTRERLNGWDRDSNYDIYDARVDGGFPEPPPPPPSCQGDACQPAPLVIADLTPGSASFTGPSNLASSFAVVAPRSAKPSCEQARARPKSARPKRKCIRQGRGGSRKKANRGRRGHR
jgi:hypothetical protein